MADSCGLIMQVLDTLCYADRTLLADNAALAGATVFVHLSSHVKVRMPGNLPSACICNVLPVCEAAGCVLGKEITCQALGLLSA